MVALLLAGCFNNGDYTIYEQLEVTESDPPPKRTVLNREEMTNKTLRYTEIKIDEVGEKVARLSVADSFSGLNDHFSSGIVDVIDSEDNKYRAVYIGNDNTVDYIENNNSKNEYEKEVLELYDAMQGANEKMPYIEFTVVE
jgi:hypothetical protein